MRHEHGGQRDPLSLAYALTHSLTRAHTLTGSLSLSLCLCSALYQIVALGDDDTDQPEVSAVGYAAASAAHAQASAGTLALPTFRPRPLRNLLLVDDIASLCPIMDAKVRNAPLPKPHRHTGTQARTLSTQADGLLSLCVSLSGDVTNVR
jgi:hypothetical protein